jgi:hypothetical protein
LGGEYVFNTKNHFALRAGVWRDPEHVIRHVGEQVPTSEEDSAAVKLFKNVSNTRAAFFQPGDDEIHYSIGAGLVFERLQLDAAMDFSDRVNTFSLSGVFFF